MDKGIFKTAGMQRAQARDDMAAKGRQFGIGNFYAWLMDKYPKLTLAQVQMKMPSLEREYAQEKAQRKNEPDMQPSVNSAFDNREEEMKAKLAAVGDPTRAARPVPKGESIEKESIKESEIARMQKLAGITVEEDAKLSVGHTDDEKGMLSKDLYLIGKNAVELHKMLKELPDSDFPHWWQSKIIKSKEYIEGAKNYLEAELSDKEAVVSPDMKDDDPSGVS